MINWQQRLPPPTSKVFKTIAANPRDRQSEMFAGEMLLTIHDTDKFKLQYDDLRRCAVCIYKVTRGMDYVRRGFSLHCMKCSATCHLPPLVAKFPEWVRVFVPHMAGGDDNSDIYVAQYKEIAIYGIEMVNEY